MFRGKTESRQTSPAGLALSNLETWCLIASWRFRLNPGKNKLLRVGASSERLKERDSPSVPACRPTHRRDEAAGAGVERAEREPPVRLGHGQLTTKVEFAGAQEGETWSLQSETKRRRSRLKRSEREPSVRRGHGRLSTYWRDGIKRSGAGLVVGWASRLLWARGGVTPNPP